MSVFLLPTPKKKSGWVNPRGLLRTEEEQEMLATLPDISRP